MKYLFSFLALVLSYTSFGQVSVTALSSCASYTLSATVTGLVPTASGIVGDDNWSDLIPIGFTYNFYGVPHTQCIIGSNGELGFDLANALAYNTWPISATLASTASTSTDIENLIAGPWCDIYIPAGGTIMYSTVGTAPNRKFEVTWCATHMYSCTTQWVTTQIIIYETTGVAEVHIGHHTFCTSWNGGYAEVGVVNSTGSSCTTAPGRDFPSNWNATNEAWRFTPAGPGYTCTSIPYAPIPYAASSVYWYDSATHAYLGSGASLVVTPGTTTTYLAAAVGCGDTTFGSVTVTGLGGGGSGPTPHISGLTSTNPTACGLCNGTVTLHGVAPGYVDSVLYALGGVPHPTYTVTAAPDSTILISGLCAGFYNYFYVKVANCPSNQLPATLVDPVLTISGITTVNPSICGLCDGSITIHGLWPGGVATINYIVSGVPHAPVTLTVAADSTVVLTGLCAGTYTGITATITGCTANGPNVTLVNPVMIISGEEFTSPSICGLCDGSIKLHGLHPGLPVSVAFSVGGVPHAPYTGYVAADSTVLLTGLCAGAYTGITATIYGCTATAPPVTLVDPPMAISAVDTTNPTVCGKCDGTITLHGLHPGLPVTVTYNKDGVAQPAYNGTVAADSTVTLTGLCAGSTTAGSVYSSIMARIYTCTAMAPDITLVNPAPIQAVFDTSIHLGCNGDTVFVNNLTTPAGYTSTWSFGDGGSSAVTDPGFHIYLDTPGYIPVPGGSYNITLTYNSYGKAYCTTTEVINVSWNHHLSAAIASVPASGKICNYQSINFIGSDPATPATYNPTFTWDFGDGTSPVSTNPVNYHYDAGPGNYTVTLTVKDDIGCIRKAYEPVLVEQIKVFTTFTDTNVCLKEPMLLHASYETYPAANDITASYLWNGNFNLDNTAIATPAFFPGVVGDFPYTVTATTNDPQACQDQASLIVHSFAPVTFTNVTASPQTIPYGSSIQLNADGAIYYTWTPNDGTLDNPNINNPVATPTDSVNIYVVHGMNMFGCLNTDTVIVYVDNSSTDDIPSGFTPNGDGLNDHFGCGKFLNSGSGSSSGSNTSISTKYRKLVDFRVYNRWGTLIFHTSNPADSWDGTFNGVPQDMGVYSYEIITAHSDGTNKVYKGNVTLIR